ncbi:hypothetical protein Pint_35223 [Pistacia integerrima]|uniref:Uncharacterized protein n=1 Tax=Pistacia integerrima TaxID=434235 RepID=A0ACC0Y392_9ROSI|nr:hypothetical protein Pint_35223 [Pistacia integerrima]
MAASSSINFIAPNLSQLVTAKLDETNYLMWLSQIVPVLKSHDLMGFVDGSPPCPSQFLIDDQGKPTTTLNPDQTCLANKFAFPSRSRINRLKWLLQMLNQGSMKCATYLDSAKQLAAQLGVVGKTIDDDDLIAYIVSGLNHSYHPFVTSLSFATRDKALSFEDFQAELLSFELLLETLQQKAKIPTKSHPQTFQPPYYSKKPAPNTKSYPSPRPNHSQQTFNTSRIPCQICGKPNHQALDCFHRMDYAFQGRHPPTQLAAMVAHTNATHVVEDPWFIDSGANQHITTNLEQLTLA